MPDAPENFVCQVCGRTLPISDLVLVPTRSGTTARILSRYKLPVWFVAPSRHPAVCQGLAFSYGVHPVDLVEEPYDWRQWIARWLRKHGVAAQRVILVAGPSALNPKANDWIELMCEGDAIGAA